MKIPVKEDGPKFSRLAILKALFYKQNKLNTPNPPVWFLGPTFKLDLASNHVLLLPPLPLRTSCYRILDY